MVKVKIKEVECKRCGYKWIPRKRIVRLCAKCRSAYWDIDRADAGYWESILNNLSTTDEITIKCKDHQDALRNQINLLGSIRQGRNTPFSGKITTKIVDNELHIRKKKEQGDDENETK